MTHDIMCHIMSCHVMSCHVFWVTHDMTQRERDQCRTLVEEAKQKEAQETGNLHLPGERPTGGMENDQDKDRTELRSSDINQDLNTCDHYKEKI